MVYKYINATMFDLYCKARKLSEANENQKLIYTKNALKAAGCTRCLVAIRIFLSLFRQAVRRDDVINDRKNIREG